MKPNLPSRTLCVSVRFISSPSPLIVIKTLSTPLSPCPSFSPSPPRPPSLLLSLKSVHVWFPKLRKLGLGVWVHVECFVQAEYKVRQRTGPQAPGAPELSEDGRDVLLKAWTLLLT